MLGCQPHTGIGFVLVSYEQSQRIVIVNMTLYMYITKEEIHYNNLCILL